MGGWEGYCSIHTHRWGWVGKWVGGWGYLGVESVLDEGLDLLEDFRGEEDDAGGPVTHLRILFVLGGWVGGWV